MVAATAPIWIPVVSLILTTIGDSLIKLIKTTFSIPKNEQLARRILLDMELWTRLQRTDFKDESSAKNQLIKI